MIVRPEKYNFNISDEEYNEARDSMPFNASKNDVLWAIYQKRQLKYWESGDLNACRFNYMCMYELMRKESNPPEAIKYLIMSLWCGQNDLINTASTPEIVITVLNKCDPIKSLNRYHIKYLCKHCEYIDYGLVWCKTIPMKMPSLDEDVFAKSIWNTVEYGENTFSPQEILQTQ